MEATGKDIRLEATTCVTTTTTSGFGEPATTLQLDLGGKITFSNNELLL